MRQTNIWRCNFLASVRRLRHASCKGIAASSRYAALAIAALAPHAHAETVADVLRAVESGQYSWAKVKAQASGGVILLDYVRWRELRDGRPLPSFEQFDVFLKAGQDWPSLRQIQARAEDALESGIDDATVLTFFARRTPVSRQGRTRLAVALLLQGDRRAAAALAGQAWIGGRFSAPQEALFLSELGDLLTPGQQRQRLARLLNLQAWSEARRQAARMEQGYRQLAEARILLQSSSAGIDRAVAAVPEALKADPGLTLDRIARARRDGRGSRARELLLVSPDTSGQPNAWWRERQIQIRDRIDAGAYREAFQIADAHRQPEDDPSFAEAEWLTGWLALRFLHQPEEAARHFKRIRSAVSSPISLARAAYWTGRAEAEAGNGKAARASFLDAASFGTAFYGQIAWLEIDQPPRLPSFAFPPPDPKGVKSFQSDRQQAVARFLCDHDGKEQAGAILSHLAEEALEDPTRLGQVASIATRCDRLDSVVQAARLGQRRGQLNAAAAFPPPPYPSLLQTGGGADPALVTAIARQESQFYPRAQSAAGAMGLLQLMPGTAKAMAETSGLDYADWRLLTDPVYNVALGRAYIDLQLKRWGEPALAIAAYNAGPKRVDEWLARYGDPRGKGLYALLDWIELIPFSETRNYVQRVLEGRNVYRVRFGWDTRLAGHPFEPRLVDPS